MSEEAKRTVAFSVEGRSYRVVTTASESDLARLAAVVEERLRAIPRTRHSTFEDRVVLAAIALANDVEEQQGRADALRASVHARLEGALRRIDDELAEPSPASEGGA
jgi:cell division protein ZapA